MSGVGSSPALATCETSQVLLAGVSVVFLGVLPFSPHLLIGPSHMGRNNLERDVKLNLKKKTKKKTKNKKKKTSNQFILEKSLISRKHPSKIAVLSKHGDIE